MPTVLPFSSIAKPQASSGASAPAASALPFSQFKAPTPPPAPAPAPKPTLGQEIEGGAKNVVKTLASGEIGFGKAMAGAATAPQAVGAAQKQVNDNRDIITSLVNENQKLKAQGKDTTHIEQALKYYAQNDANGVQSVMQSIDPNINTSGKDVAESAASTAADIGTAGTFGADVKGMKAGVLAAKKEIPTAIKVGTDLVDKATPIVKKAAGFAGAMGKKLALGGEAISTLDKLGDEEAKKFFPEAKGGIGKTFSDVVHGTQDAIRSFVAKSKSDLQAVKNSIPKVTVDAKKVASSVNDAIMRSVENSAAYKGTTTGVEKGAAMFKNPEELVNSGVFDEAEVPKIKGMVNAVQNWSDFSARGVLNLKEKLGVFYKDGLNGSNKVLSNIQSNLKDIVGEVAPKIKPALEKASANIDKAESFTRNLIGRDTITGESKLKTIASKINNPALNDEKIGLLQDLKNLTGHDVIPELKGFSKYTDLVTKQAGGDVENLPSKAGVIAKTLAKRAGIAGGIGALAAEGKKVATELF